MDQKDNPKSIKIGDVEGFRNLKNAKRFAIDIGKYVVSVIIFIVNLRPYAVSSVSLT